MNTPIVITGMGIVCPLGCGVNRVWQRLVAGKSGIGFIDRFDATEFPIKIAGQVPSADVDQDAGFNPENVADRKELKKLDLFSLYAFAAAEEALQQAQWQPKSDAERAATATIIGTGIGGLPTITQAQNTLVNKGLRRLSPFTAPAFLANMAAGNLSIRYGFTGPLGCPVTACAASLQAIGDGLRLIRSGEAKVALVGGTEACIDPLGLGSFHAMKALATEDTQPELASRPFDRDRSGFVMGEGAGLMVIESLDHALARGAQPLAQISGYGTSADAYHITSGREDGLCAAAAVQRALSMAELPASAIDYVNAHATSTPVGDQAEVQSLRRVFGSAINELAISSTKSATGHLLGATGGVEAIFTAMATLHNQVPPTLNLDQADKDMSDLNLVPLKAQAREVSNALCNGFGFGGVNASLIISKLAS